MYSFEQNPKSLKNCEIKKKNRIIYLQTPNLNINTSLKQKNERWWNDLFFSFYIQFSAPGAAKLNFLCSLKAF